MKNIHLPVSHSFKFFFQSHAHLSSPLSWSWCLQAGSICLYHCHSWTDIVRTWQLNSNMAFLLMSWGPPYRGIRFGKHEKIFCYDLTDFWNLFFVLVWFPFFPPISRGRRRKHNRWKARQLMRLNRRKNIVVRWHAMGQSESIYLLSQSNSNIILFCLMLLVL